MQTRFGLTPYLEAGKVMQVPSDKLDNFALTRDRGDAPAGVLVRLRVLAPGWKRGGEVVVPPRAELIAGLASACLFAAAAARRSISSGETSSMWVATVHMWPKGSSSVPVRSP